MDDMTSTIVSLLTVALGSGALATLVTAIANRKRNKAETDATNINSIIQIDKILEDKVASLHEEIEILKSENSTLKTNIINIQTQIQQLTSSNDELKEENKMLKNKIIELKEINKKLKEENDLLKQKGD